MSSITKQTPNELQPTKQTHPLPELLVRRDGDGGLLLPFGQGEGVDFFEEFGHAAHELLFECLSVCVRGILLKIH